jgi:hypothetical protein
MSIRDESNMIEVDLSQDILSVCTRVLHDGQHILGSEGMKTVFGKTPRRMRELLSIHREHDSALGEFRSARFVFSESIPQSLAIAHTVEEAANLFHRRLGMFGDG